MQLLFLRALPALVSAAAAVSPTQLSTIKLAPFAEAALRHQPDDPTIGRPIPGTETDPNETVIFFTPACNCYRPAGAHRRAADRRR